VRKLTLLLLAALCGCGGGEGRIVVSREANVSQAAGPQVEAAIAIDPSDPEIMLAGSNSSEEPSVRSYTSTDGGTTWRSEVAPLPPEGWEGGAGDPTVAIGPGGRQYFGFLARLEPTAPYVGIGIFVASRVGPDADWRVVRVDNQPGVGNDKPAIAVDQASGRVYVAWTRDYGARRLPVEVSYSDDGGRSWSLPVRVADTGPQLFASIAVGPGGTVYVVWDEFFAGKIALARSLDGGDSFEDPVEVAGYEEGIWGTTDCPPYGVSIPAQPRDCVRPNPIVTAGGGRVHVTWGADGENGSQDAFVRSFDAELRSLGEARVLRPDGDEPSDQFWPTSAYDRSDGTLWACFYDTRDDPSRRKARFTCTASRDGGDSWSAAAPAASVDSDETAAAASIREYGDYEMVAAAGGRAHAAWTDSRRLALWGEEIYAARLELAD
jgi:hypothetical protein